MRNLIKLLLLVSVVNATEDHDDGLTSTGGVLNQSNVDKRTLYCKNLKRRLYHLQCTGWKRRVGLPRYKFKIIMYSFIWSITSLYSLT